MSGVDVPPLRVDRAARASTTVARGGDAIVRREAIDLIGQIGGEEAIRYLRAAAKDPSGSNRRAVTRAIEAVMESLQD